MFFLLTGEDYQELTQPEEKDLEEMISQTENAISNIEAFTEKLSKDLSVLDGVIILLYEAIYMYFIYVIDNLKTTSVTNKLALWLIMTKTNECLFYVDITLSYGLGAPLEHAWHQNLIARGGILSQLIIFVCLWIERLL